jgi:hypothetical protein
MSKDSPDIVDRIDNMSLDECLTYDRAAKGVNIIIGLFGVGLSFLLIAYLTPMIIVACGSVLYFLGTVSSGIGAIRILLRERILKLDK